MSTQHRRFIVLIVVVFVAAVIAGLYLAKRGREGSRHDTASTRIRALLMGMTIYAQNHGDDYPPPDRASALLVDAGILDRDVFEALPGVPAGEPAFFAVVPVRDGETVAGVVGAAKGRWSKSFERTRMVLYTNPAAFGGAGAYVAHSDGMTDWVTMERIEKAIKDAGGRAVPVR